MRLSGVKLQGSIHRRLLSAACTVGPILAVGSLTTPLALSLKKKTKKTAMRTLKDKLNNLNPQLREKVEARATQLIAEEMTRRELRQAAISHNYASRKLWALPRMGFTSGKA
jgi:hypothetical protein